MQNNRNLFRVVKLDRRHKKYKDGFTYGLRFDGFNHAAMKCEKILQNMYPNNRVYSANPAWTYYLGSNRTGGSRTYWINVRHESDITGVLLSLDFG